MKIAHISDLHLFSLDSIPLSRLMNRRVLGLANVLYVRRAHQHQDAAGKILQHLLSMSIDHVAFTGDASNLALESEFQATRQLFASHSLGGDRLSMVPGNHDVYTQGSFDSRRFHKWFEGYMGDAPTKFPYVKPLGDEAIVIGLSSATTEWPLFSSGELGSQQLARLGQILREPAHADKLKLVLCHHPPFALKNPMKTWMKGLRDREALNHILSRESHVFYLHGHLHHSHVRRQNGVTVLGATSTSLGGRHELPSANVYTFERVDGQFALQCEQVQCDGGRINVVPMNTSP